MENKKVIVTMVAIGILVIVAGVLGFLIYKAGKKEPAQVPDSVQQQKQGKSVEEQVAEVQEILDKQSSVQEQQNVEKKPVEEQVKEVQTILDEQSKSTSSSSSSSSKSTKSSEEQIREVQAILDAQK